MLIMINTSRLRLASPLLAGARGFAAKRGAAAPGRASKQQATQLTHGVAHVHSTYNNTVITVTTTGGDTVLWGSCGTVGFKGARRSTYYAAQVAAEDVGKRAREVHGVKTLDVSLKGLGQGRMAAAKGLSNVGVQVTSIRDTTPQPHNGCRRRKPRRL